MTQMSDYNVQPSHRIHANPATTRVRSVVARALHDGGVLRAVVFFAMFAGCVIPPSLSSDTPDAAVNSPPAIISVRADLVAFPQYSELVFEKGNNAGTLNLTLYDTDLGDTLFVKIFVNYNHPDPTPARSTCQTAGRTVVRTATCPMNGVCQTGDVGADPLPIMQVFVSDLDPLPDQLPLYQAMPPGGLSTTQTFFLHCQDPSP
jgi:hypothetical protein